MNYEEEAFKRRTYNVYSAPTPKNVSPAEPKKVDARRTAVTAKVPAITFHTPKTKPLAEVTASDIPRGLNAEDVATDCG